MKLFARPSIRLAIFALLALALVWPLLPDAARMNEFRDAQVLMAYERAAVDTVKQYGQFPSWNPYYCGGFHALGAPQGRFAAPTFLFSLLFGAERAELVIVFLLALAGMEGTYRWLSTRVESLAAFVVAPVFALSGHFAVAYFRGWTGFFGFELVPWILFGTVLAGRGRLAGLWIAPLAFAFLLGFGGAYAAPLVAVAAITEAARTFFERPRSLRGHSAAMLVACGAFMISLAAFRLWPMAETLYAAPRIMAGTPGHVPRALLAALTHSLVPKDGDVELAGQFYIGAVFLAVVALGLSDRRGAKAMSIAIVFLWFAAGYARKPGLFPLLRELPVFAALRYPERFLWLVILFACEPAARAFADVPRMGEGKWWRNGAWIVLGLALGWTILGEIITFDRVASARTLGGVEAALPAPAFHQSRGNRWLAAHEEAMGVGSLSCWETYPVPQSPLLRGDLPAEEYPAERDAGTVKRLHWSPNEIVLDVAMERAGVVRINQNWHPGWRSTVGRVVANDGLLAIDVPAGRHVLTLAFRPWSSMGGGAVSLAALVSLLILTLGRAIGSVPFTRRSAVLSVTSVVLPFVVFGAMLRFSPEPPVLRAEPKNANGTPAFAQKLPANAIPIDAVYQDRVHLMGATVRGPDKNQSMVVDLWLARDAAIPKSSSMFVHFERRDATPVPDGKESFFNHDHQVIAGSLYLSDAPKGQLVHDAFGAGLGKAASGTWDVWIAFGALNGARWRVVTTASTDKDRVKIGTFVIR